jgi:hypothetical protein
VTAVEPVPETQSFECPRCGADAVEPWYGPCASCRTTLRTSLGGEARDVVAADYVPKMNVTPNAVATKD